MWDLLSTALELGRPGRFAAVASSEPARAWWEVFLIAMGAVVTCAAFLAVVFKVARPHVDRYVRSLVAPMQSQLEDVHSEVSPDKGSSLRDQVTINTGQLVTLGRQIGRVNRQLHQVDKRQRDAEAVMTDHLAEATVLASTLHSLAELAEHMEGKDEHA